MWCCCSPCLRNPAQWNISNWAAIRGCSLIFTRCYFSFRFPPCATVLDSRWQGVRKRQPCCAGILLEYSVVVHGMLLLHCKYYTRFYVQLWWLSVYETNWLVVSFLWAGLCFGGYLGVLSSIEPCNVVFLQRLSDLCRIQQFVVGLPFFSVPTTS